MKAKIHKNMMLLAAASAALASIAICLVFYSQLSGLARRDLKERALVIKEIIDSGDASYAALSIPDMRVTILSPEGDVLFDDDMDFAALGNHSDRAEVQAALQSGTGESERFSHTLDKEAYYFAIKLKSGDILRLAKTTDSVRGMFGGIIPFVLLIVLAVLAAGYFGAGKLAARIVGPINEIDPDSEIAAPYDELTPLVQTILHQREKIDGQIADLQSRSDTISAIMDSMREGMVLVDKQGVILSANRSALSVFNADDDMRGKNIMMLFRDMALIDHARAALKGNRSEYGFSRAGRDYQVFFNPAVDNGDIILFLDATEKNAAEKIRREFSANVSHELKTPLTNISAYAEMIADGMAQEQDIPGVVKKIKDEAGRLIALIEDVIMLSKLDERQALPEAEEVDLHDVAFEVKDALALKAKDANITIEIPEEHAVVRGSGTMLFEMLYNLCDNAIKYNRPEGRVQVGLRESGGQVFLIVQDTGVGIPKAEQSRVFERFYRVDKSRSKITGGTGLGLSIVKHIALIHGGSVSLKSEDGKGTSVQVRLPRAAMPR